MGFASTDARDVQRGGAAVEERRVDGDASPSASPPLLKRTIMRWLVLVFSWWSMSIMVVLLIKDVVRQFSCAFALSGVANIVTGAQAWLLAHALLPPSPRLPPLTWDEALKLSLIGTIQGVEIACANKSLEYLSVSARTMCTSLNILFMMVTASVWGLEQLGCARLATAMLLTSGGVLQSLDHLAGEDSASQGSAYLQGLLLQLTTMLFASQRWALVQLVTQRSPTDSALARMSKSKLQLIARTLPITGLVCLTLSFHYETDLNLQARVSLGVGPNGVLLAKIMSIATGIMVLTVAELAIVRSASAVSLQILGTLQHIPLALAGVLIFKEEVRFQSLMGFVLCLCGGICYFSVREGETRRPAFAAAAQPPADKLEGATDELQWMSLDHDAEDEPLNNP